MKLQDWIVSFALVAGYCLMQWALVAKVYEPKADRAVAIVEERCDGLDRRFDEMERFLLERVKAVEVMREENADIVPWRLGL